MFSAIGLRVLLFLLLQVFSLTTFVKSFSLRKELILEKGKHETDICPFHPLTNELTEKDLENLLPQFNAASNFIESQIDERTRPGISANVVYKNKIIWEENFGQISRTNTTKPTGDTIYRIASISKVFPTTFLYKLWEEGKVRLNDPITKYAPNFAVKNPFHFEGQLTLHDLASQISGLQSFFSFDLLKNDYFAWNGTLEQTLEKIRNELTLTMEPRTACYYSNMAYALLAKILARNFTDDGNFENWAQKNIVDVLKLSNTGFILTDDIKAKIATGYYPTGQVAPLVDINWFRPAGHYYSSAKDLAHLTMNFMGTSDESMLKRETLVQMLTPVQKCGHGYVANYTGTPWEINEKLSYLVVRKDGDIDGYSSTIAMIPDLEFAVITMMNGARPLSSDMAQSVINMVVPTLIDILKKKNQTLVPTNDPSKYVGVYKIDNIQTWNVTANADKSLVMSSSPRPSGFGTFGLSYMIEGTFKLTILGGAFPCIVGRSNLDYENGQIVTFSNQSSGQYQQFDMPGLDLFKFKRQN